MSWKACPLTYTIQTTNPLALEVRRAELVADIVDHIVNVFDRHKLEPIRRKKREVANMLIGQMVFGMGANLPDEVDDGMLFSRELIEAIPDSYIAEYLRCMRKAGGNGMPLSYASVLTEAELKELAAKCDVKNKLIAALAELKICASYLNSHDVNVPLEKISSGGGVRFAIGKMMTEEISTEVYDRLVLAFAKTAFAKTADADAAICAVIMRYSTLGSMGHQFGVPRRIKDALRDRLGANFELMASALNHHYENYCSLFYDVERPFGSSGPINHVTPLEGVFISNPPYEQGILSAMIDVFIGALDTAEKDGKYLVFLFGLPDWHDNPPFYDKFRKSKYKICEIKFQGMWENLTTGLLMPLKMTSYRCMMGTGFEKVGELSPGRPLGHSPMNGHPKNIFASIVEEWRAMSAKPITRHAPAQRPPMPISRRLPKKCG